MPIKRFVRHTLNRLGYDIRALDSTLRWGQDPWHDMLRVYPPGQRPIVFDVGANVGQTAVKCEEFLDSPIIYSFEPDKEAFAELAKRCRHREHVSLFNMALGAENSTCLLRRQSSSTMNSLLEPGDGWGVVESTDEVEVRTLDSICEQYGIERIDLLKIDTQGYDLEVVKGAVNMLQSERIRFVLMEVNFVPMYQGQAEWDLIYRTMKNLGFRIQAIYNLVYVDGEPTYTDVLFQKGQQGKNS